MSGDERRVIIASSLGTIFEWYDFYLYGSLAIVIGAKFFGQFPETTRNIFALLAFAAGFLVRPFGALVFGRLGDLIGRKYTFLVTMMIMGLATFAVGVTPTSQDIGITAAVIMVTLRILQGLAIGGEYGGAATYVAEHAPADRRGFYTSWVQTTGTLGLFLSLTVTLGVQAVMSNADFQEYGWRIPFLVSIVLLAVSLWIRLSLAESPAFARMKAQGTHSRAPLSDAFGQWSNARVVILATVGLVAGQAMVWYCGQFYALFFMTGALKVDIFSANVLLAWSLFVGALGFVFFGWLSDKVGRKIIILSGCAIAALTYFPAFKLMTTVANPALAQAQETVPVVVVADEAECSFQFSPANTAKFTSGCDVAKATLLKLSVSYTKEVAPPGAQASVKIGDNRFYPSSKLFVAEVTSAIAAAGYPSAMNSTVVKVAGPFDIFRPQPLKLIGILLFLMMLVTMVYGPMAAALVELFPTRVRYTSMSFSYHLGNGWLGGLLPAAVLALNAESGNMYFGLWYPVGIAGVSALFGLMFLPETKDRDIYEGDATYRQGRGYAGFEPDGADI
jgi:MFS family permease